MGILGGVLVATGGTALGAGIAYLGAEVRSFEIVAFGLILIPVSIVYGYELASKQVQESVDVAVEELDTSEYYRFVRFLPDYAWVGYSDSLNYPVQVKKKDKMIREIVNKKQETQNTIILYYPDASEK